MTIEANPSDDEGLASVFFQLEDGSYFTLCRSEDDDDAYFEYSDQSTGVYSNKVTFEINAEGVVFSLGRSVAASLKLPQEITVVWPRRNVSARVKKALDKILPMRPSAGRRGNSGRATKESRAATPGRRAGR